MKDGSKPAFPQIIADNDEPGMSLRDWFAGMAPEPSEEEITGEMNLDRARNPHNEPYAHMPKRRTKDEVVSYLRYRRADAMLVEREKR